MQEMVVVAGQIAITAAVQDMGKPPVRSAAFVLRQLKHGLDGVQTFRPKHRHCLLHTVIGDSFERERVAHEMQLSDWSYLPEIAEKNTLTPPNGRNFCASRRCGRHLY